jgi:hypothetical protein
MRTSGERGVPGPQLQRSTYDRSMKLCGPAVGLRDPNALVCAVVGRVIAGYLRGHYRRLPFPCGTFESIATSSTELPSGTQL